MPVTHLKTVEEFDDFLKSKNLLVIHFFAQWAEQCTQMNDLLEDLSKNVLYTSVKFAKVEAEELSELSLKSGITAVPAVILFKNQKEVDRVNGANPSLVVEKLKEHTPKSSDHVSTTKPQLTGDERLKSLINQAKCMLFMKGNPQTPKCGFSRTIIGILDSYKADYKTFDILEDNIVREGLKKFSNWPTYPQLYVDGELLGGLDIVKEMSESGELEEMLPKKQN